MRILLSLTLMMMSFESRAESASIEIEKLYDRLVSDISDPSQFIGTITSADQAVIGLDPTAIAVDALWDMSFEDSVDMHRSITNIIDVLALDVFSVGDKIRLYTIGKKLGHTGLQMKNLYLGIIDEIEGGVLDKRSVIIAFSHQEFLKSEFGADRIENVFASHTADLRDIKEVGGGFEPKTKDEIKELVFTNLNLTQFLNGQYQNTSKIVMFCRHDRNYPCRYLIKNKNNLLEKNQDGSIWVQPSLAQSARGLPYNVTGGNTPSGVYTIDSVMPEADKQAVFGKFRRFILNFVPASTSEAELKLTLPPLSRANSWWKESVIARDAGRNLLRIHGTGKPSEEPESTYYPHVKTSGCVSQIEGKYTSRIYQDQRNLLDTFMISLGLQPRYQNEPSIKGLFYVIEVDDVRAPVLVSDIKQWLDLQ